MNKEELYDLIERYIDGALTDAERAEVEHRLSTDAGFRAEVELHRALHTSLGDAGNRRLRTALDNLLRDPPPVDDAPPPETPPIPPSGWTRLAGIVFLLAVAGFSVWRWLAPDDDTLPPVSQPAQHQPVDTASFPRQSTPADTATVPVRPNPNKPIAMADPSDFVPNPALETRIDGMMRGNELRGNAISFELSSPAAGASFQLQNGQVVLPVRGNATGGEIPADQPLELLIYPNRPEAWDNEQPVATFPLPAVKVDAGVYRVNYRPAFRTRPGLYYLVIGQRRQPGIEEGGHILLWIGKFTVQPAK